MAKSWVKGDWVVFGSNGNKGATEKLLEKQLGKVDLKKFETRASSACVIKVIYVYFIATLVAPEPAK